MIKVEIKSLQIKIIIINNVCCWHQNRHRDWWNRPGCDPIQAQPSDSRQRGQQYTLEVCEPPYLSKLLLPFACSSPHLPSSRQQPSQALCFQNICAGEITLLFPMASILAHYLRCPVAFSIPADLGPDQWPSNLLTLLPSITLPPPTAILAATGLAPWFGNHLSLV